VQSLHNELLTHIFPYTSSPISQHMKILTYLTKLHTAQNIEHAPKNSPIVNVSLLHAKRSQTEILVKLESYRPLAQSWTWVQFS